MKYKTEQEREIGYHARYARYYLKHKEKLLKRTKEWKSKHPGYQKEWYKKHYVKKIRSNHKVRFICENCGKVERVWASRIKKINFCSTNCFKEWQKKKAVDPEIRRIRLNKYQNEWKKRKRLESPQFLEKLKNRQIRLLLKVLKKYKRNKVKREKIKYKLEHKRVILTEEERKERRRRYKKEHPEKFSSFKGISKEVFNKIKRQQNYRCYYCWEEEPFLDQYWHFLTQDHYIPRSKGGRKRSKENIVAACWDCNIDKSNKLL